MSFGHGRVFHVSRNSIFGLDGQYILTLHIPWKVINRLLLLLKLLTHMYMCMNSFLVQEPCNFFSPPFARTTLQLWELRPHRIGWEVKVMLDETIRSDNF